MAKIIVDDGLKSYDIVNKHGDVIGVFKFNPADFGIIKRYEEVQKRYEALEIPEKGASEQMTEIADMLIKEMDYLINGDSREAFFATTFPLTPLATGEFYIENCLNALAKVIEMELGERIKKVKSRTSKYTAKYHK